MNSKFIYLYNLEISAKSMGSDENLPDRYKADFALANVRFDA